MSDRDMTPSAAYPRAGTDTVRGRLRAALELAGGPVPPVVAGWIAAIALVSIRSPNVGLSIGLGFAGAFVAGLVGIGGAIIMIPLLLFVPPLFGMRPEGIHGVAGVTMVQVAAAGVVGMLAHRRAGNVESTLVLTLGGAMMIASLAGAVLSRSVSPEMLSGVFASLALVAAILMLSGGRRLRFDRHSVPLVFSKPLAVLLGVGVGILVGMVGAGGGFLLIPLMVWALGVPMRVAVGSSLAIVALSGIAGAMGKALTGQVDWYLALALVSGALPGARLGSTVSKWTRADLLALLLGVLIAVTAARMWWDILVG